MPRRPTHLLSTLVAASALGACVATSPDPEPLWGSDWQLQSIAGQSVLPQPVATLGFPQAGQVAGYGGCNRFFGTVVIDGSRITFGPLASTKMACPGGASEQESRYLAALQKAQRYEVQNNTLLIHSPGVAQPLRLIRTAPRQ